MNVERDDEKDDDERRAASSSFREVEVEVEDEDEDEDVAKAPAGEYFRAAGARAFRRGDGFAEDAPFEPVEAPATPDGDERFGRRGPTPRAAPAPRATAFSPM